jgi:hypothetical protein
VAFAPMRAPSCTILQPMGPTKTGYPLLHTINGEPAARATDPRKSAECRFPQVPASQAQGRLRSLRSLDPPWRDQGPSAG